MEKKAIEKAAYLLGSQAALAKAVGVSPMVVTHWKNRGIPKRRCISIAAATGGKVTVHDLRPDIYGPPPPSQPETATAAA